jgi:hypothetical protein
MVSVYAAKVDVLFLRCTGVFKKFTVEDTVVGVVSFDGLEA